MPFGNALFDLQREYGLYSGQDFVFPLMSLAIIERTARIICPGLDFQEIGRSGPVLSRRRAQPVEDDGKCALLQVVAPSRAQRRVARGRQHGHHLGAT